MKRLLICVEGQTEETFVNEVLRGNLGARGFQSVSARLIGNPRKRRGGIQGWNRIRPDLLRLIKQDRGCYITTMVDFYGLPRSGAEAWPGRAEASNLPFTQKATYVQDACLDDIDSDFDGDLYPKRFIPFVVMHEFEGLLFSDPPRFAIGIGMRELTQRFSVIRDQFNSPEEINDTSNGHPSQRVEDLVPGYQKPLLGTLAALEIGLDAMRNECSHFRQWLDELEALPDISN